MGNRTHIDVLLFAALCVTWSASASAQPPSDPPPSNSTQASEAADPEPDDDAQEARANRHFLSGVNLYRDGNWAGALAEFEAAYALKPSAGTMQNIALCLKSLFRYSEAATRLEQLLEEHRDQMADDERTAVREAIEELSALVGTVRITVKPSTAKVTLDGQAVSAEERALGIRLNVGEHTIVADAPGYARTTHVLRLAGGQQVVERVVLKPTAGFVTVETGDPDAAIAIDGKPLAFERWTGPIAPGRRLLQVYKEGHQPLQRRVDVKVGESVTIRVSFDEANATTAADAGVEQPPPPATAREADGQRGFYALAAATVFALGQLPEGLDLSQSDDRAGGVSGGIRAGYRLWTPLAIEAMLEGGRHEVPEVNVDDPGSLEVIPARYTLDSFRTGGNLRIMSGGERLRFTSIVGAGAVFRTLKLTHDGEEIGDAAGVDPYLLIELGAQLNLGHVLLELDFVASIEGTAGTAGNLLGGDSGEVFRKSGGGLRLLGIGLRGGWSEWAPGSSARLHPHQRR